MRGEEDLCSRGQMDQQFSTGFLDFVSLRILKDIKGSRGEQHV